MADPQPPSIPKTVKLFNRWQFQEAQDMFRQLAEQSEGRDRALLEALGNVSSAFHRIWQKGGEPNAMVSYLEKGIEQLRSFSRPAAGIRVEGLVDQLQLCLEEAFRWRRREAEIFNRDLIPRVELDQDT
jgi:hypothetical protein